eukprot:PhM_4_TR1321/c3_g1_i5/m.101089
MVRDWKCQDCAKPTPQKVKCGQGDCKYDGGHVVIAQANHCTGCDMYFHNLHVSGQTPKPFLCSACRGTTRGRGKAPSLSPSSTSSSQPSKPASTASSSPSSSSSQPSAAPLPEPPKVPPTAQSTKAPTKVPMKAPAKPAPTTSAPATPAAKPPVTTPTKVPFKVPMKVPAQPPAPAAPSQTSPPRPPPPKPPSPSPSPEPQQPGFHQSQTSPLLASGSAGHFIDLLSKSRRHTFKGHPLSRTGLSRRTRQQHLAFLKGLLTHVTGALRKKSLAYAVISFLQHEKDTKALMWNTVVQKCGNAAGALKRLAQYTSPPLPSMYLTRDPDWRLRHSVRMFRTPSPTA